MPTLSGSSPPREHAVPCANLGCQRTTWRTDAICGVCAGKADILGRVAQLRRQWAGA